jgi:linoleoyl-CoA desaturase
MQAFESNQNYRALAEQINAGGWYRPAAGRILSELLLHIALFAGGIAALLCFDNYFLKAVAGFLSGVGALGIATNTHTSSHFATTRSSRLNKFLTYFGYTFLFGTSANYWWHKHCVVHHPSPNVIGVDVDADLMPWFAVSERDIETSRGLRHLFFRYQWLLIPFAIGLNVFNTQRQGWAFLLPILLDPKRRHMNHWLDLGVLFCHWTCWLVIPSLFLGVTHVLSIYLTLLVLLGYGMFIAFAPAHFPAEAAFVDATRASNDFLYRQTLTTVNFRTGWFGRLVCSGVDFQIEHHLFPGIPHVHYPKLSPIVEEFCRQHGYPYLTLGWAEGIWKSLLIFKRPKPVEGQILAGKEPAVTVEAAVNTGLI